MSSVQPSTLHFPAGLPIDEATRKEHANAGQTNRMARNARSNERGAIEKRLGTTRIQRLREIGPFSIVGTSHTTGAAVFSHQGTPTLIDDAGIVDSWVEPLGTWAVRGRASEADYDTLDIPAAPLVAGAPVDSEVCGDYLCTVYTEVATTIPGTPRVGSVYASVVHLPTGAVVRTPEVLGGVDQGVFAQVAQFDGRYLIACVLSDVGSIAAFILDTQALATGWSTLVASVVATTSVITGVVMSMCSMGDRVGLAFVGTTAQKTQRRTLNLSGIVNSANASGATSPNGIDIAYSGGLLWLAQAGGTVSTTTNTQLYSNILVPIGLPLAVTSANTTIDVVIAAGPGVARSWTTYTNGTAQTQSYTGSAGASALSGTTNAFRSRMTTRPFYRGGVFYGIFGDGVVADWSKVGTVSPALRPIANVFPGLVGSGRTTPRSFAKVTPWGAKWVTAIALNVGTSLVGFNGGALASRAVILDFAAKTRSCSVEHHGVTVLGGGLVQQYDGDRVHELGFLESPTINSVTLAAGAVTGTNYRYVAIYEDVGADGSVTVSGVSFPSSPVSPAAQQMLVNVSKLELTSRYRPDAAGDLTAGALRVTVYRTLSGGAPPYYRVGSAKLDPTVTFAIVNDNLPDASLSSSPLLYAPNLPGVAGESLDRRAPPGLQNLVSYNGMLVGSRENSVYNSGQSVYGEATWFSPVFETPLPAGEDEITALMAVDGTLFPTKRGEIYAMSGEPPSDNGASGGMGQPRRLSSDCGCIEPRSVVATSMGALFQSERGIELLSRSQTVEFIGENIQGTQAAHPTVVSAVLDAKHSLVRMAMVGTDEFAVTTGVTAVFDLTRKAWVSIDSMPLIPSGACMTKTAGALRYTWMSTTGFLYAEKVDGENDDYLEGGATWITLEYTTAPIHFGLQQEQRAYEFMLLFEMNAAAGIEVQIAHDYGAFGAVDTAGKSWSDLETAGQFQLPFRPLRPRSEAIELIIRDVQKSGILAGSCKGPTFIGVSTDMAVKMGNNRGTPRVNAGLRR